MQKETHLAMDCYEPSVWHLAAVQHALERKGTLFVQLQPHYDLQWTPQCPVHLVPQSNWRHDFDLLFCGAVVLVQHLKTLRAWLQVVQEPQHVPQALDPEVSLRLLVYQAAGELCGALRVLQQLQHVLHDRAT